MFGFLTRQYQRAVNEYFHFLLIIIPIAFLVRSFGYGLYRVPSGSMEPTMLVGDRFFADKFSVHFFALKRGDIIAFNDPTYPYAGNALIAAAQRYMWGPQNFTKRIIGLPGDHVQGKIEEGKPVVYVNDGKLEEPYINVLPLIPINFYPEQWRSYDPAVPYDQQALYVMDETRVKKVQKWLARHGRPTIRYPNTLIAVERNGVEQKLDEFDVVLGKNQYWVMGDNRQASSDSREWGPLNGAYIHGKILYRLWSVDSESSWWILDLVWNPLDCWKKFRWNRSFRAVS